MKTFRFDRKDQSGLAMDFGRFDSTPQFFFENEQHRTDFFEILFINEGKGSLYLDSQSLTLEPNKCFFISPFQTRRWKLESGVPEGFFVIFKKEFFETFFEDKLFIYRLNYFYNPNFPFELNTSSQTIENFSCILEEIERESTNLNYFSEHVVRSWLYLLLVQLNRAFAKAHGIEEEDRLNNAAYEFRKVVEESVPQIHSVEEIAQSLKMSRITLNKKVKEHFKVSATQFLKDRLAIEIKKKLLYSDQTVAEISNELMFSEPTNMIRFFKRVMGLTPTQFRAGLSN
ncbi:MAG: helix-turn-helix domain-containing protein [Bacteroidota bacterium]